MKVLLILERTWGKQITEEHWRKEREEMAEELKNKIDKIVNDFYTSSKSVTLYRNLKEFAYDVANEVTKDFEKENNRLEGQISLLLSCKDCLENKGGYICKKEYNDKCLSQKIQYIKELKEELAKMTSVAEHQQDCNMKRYFKLEQAKEILKAVVYQGNSEGVEKCTIEWAEQFISESE